MPVVGTKLHMPKPRRQLVPRPRLTQVLLDDPAAMPRLVLVAAPAGFGKTTVLVQWLSATGAWAAGSSAPERRVAWLSLDAEDSDVTRFLTHVIAALQTTSPDIGTDASSLLATGGSGATMEVLVSLVNDLD